MAEYISLLRVLQLCLGTLIGFGTIYLGYRLFSQIPVTVTNDGTFKMPKIGEVKLKVAPGIFFALLGSVITFCSINRSIEVLADHRDFENAAQASVTGELLEKNARNLSFDLSRSPSFKYTCLPGPLYDDAAAGSSFRQAGVPESFRHLLDKPH